VISKKGLPSLRRRSPWPHHVLRYGRLPDIDAEHEEFAVDPRCTPKRVRNTHVSNELANLQCCLRSTTARSRFPAPTGSEADVVPADHRFRFEDFQSVQHARAKRYSPANTRRSMLLKATRFGDLRRSTLSWCRRTRISASSRALDRNSLVSAQASNLKKSIIGNEHRAIRDCSLVE
jgi:hypothetical protein